MDYSNLLESGIDKWNQWRAQNPDDAGDLSGLDLSEGYFFEANFEGTNLANTKLQRACLIGANCTNANFSYADLGGAYAGDANLYGANLTGANLGGANLNKADLRQAILVDVDISEANTYRARLSQPGKSGLEAASAAPEVVVSKAEAPEAEAPKIEALEAEASKAEASISQAEVAVASATVRQPAASKIVKEVPARSQNRVQVRSQNGLQSAVRTSATATALAAPPEDLAGDESFSGPARREASDRANPFWSRMVRGVFNRPVMYGATAIAALLILGPSLYQATIERDWNQTASNSDTALDKTDTSRADKKVQLVAEQSDMPLALAKSFDIDREVWAVDTYLDADNELRIASGGGGGQIQLLDAKTGEVMRMLSGHEDTVRDLAVSNTGQRLASSSSDGIKVWDTSTGDLLYSLSSAGSPIWAVAISPDDSTLISGDYAGTISVWDLETGDLLYSVDNGSTVWSIAIAPDGSSFVTGGKDRIQHWSLADGWPLQEFVGHAADIRSVAISPDGRTLASGSWDSTIKLWDLESGKLKSTLEGHEGRVVSVDFSADGTRLASGSIDNTTRLWDLSSEKLTETLDSKDWVLEVAFLGSEKTLISAGKDKAVRLWR